MFVLISLGLIFKKGESGINIYILFFMKVVKLFSLSNCFLNVVYNFSVVMFMLGILGLVLDDWILLRVEFGEVGEGELILVMIGIGGGGLLVGVEMVIGLLLIVVMLVLWGIGGLFV